MSNQQDYPKKKKQPSSKSKIALPLLMIIIGAIAGNAGFVILLEYTNSIIEVRPPVISAGAVLLFIVFTLCLIPLLQLSTKSPEKEIEDKELLEESDRLIAIIERLEETEQSVRSKISQEFSSDDIESEDDISDESQQQS